jgi:putative acetyltransferase
VISIVPIQSNQIEAAKRVIRSAWQEYFAEDADPATRGYMDNPATLADLDEAQSRFLAFLVVVDGAALVGCGGVRRLDDDTAELKRIFLLKPYRGHGLGRQLTERLLDIARAFGFKRVRLDTHQKFAESHALYRRLGFYPIPAYTNLPNAYFMERLL